MADNDFDLSSLDTSNNSEDKPVGKSASAVQAIIRTKAKFAVPVPLQPQEIVMMKVKSNSIRDRALVVDTLVLRFDEKGVAEVPEHSREILERHMAVHPGRLTLLEPEVVVPAPVVEEVKVPSALEVEADVAVEAEPEEEPDMLVEEEKEKPRKFRRKKSSSKSE